MFGRARRITELEERVARLLRQAEFNARSRQHLFDLADGMVKKRNELRRELDALKRAVGRAHEVAKAKKVHEALGCCDLEAE